MPRLEKPPKNYDTVLKLLQFIKNRISTITWNDDYTQALEDAFWSDPGLRNNTSFHDPVPSLPGRHSTPKPTDTSNRDISFRKLKPRFTHQIRSIFRLLKDPDQDIDTAKVDHSDSMYKSLVNLRQCLDKYDE